MKNRIEDSAESATSIPAAVSPTFSLGAASGLDVLTPGASVASPGIATSLQYLYGEYFRGILFVIASTAFILAVPSMLIKRERAAAMIGRIGKRAIDVVGSLCGLILTSPLFLILPLLIRIDTRGPVFYTQARVGENQRRRDRRYHQRVGLPGDRRRRDRRREDLLGRPFQLIKFRTMREDAEKHSGPVWAAKDDPRVTRVGAILRKTRLDEIPQFINVLRGEMSLVGPRPERPVFVRELSEKIPGYERRLEVKPGITGLAQVEAGYDSSLATVMDKLSWDVQYIDNWSLWLDVKILCRTIKVVFTGKGAH